MHSPAVSGVIPRISFSNVDDNSPFELGENTPLSKGPSTPYNNKRESLQRYDTKLPLYILRRQKLETILQGVLYGVINSILTIPCMYGYAAIIFSHPDFKLFMPLLAKLVLFSSVIHQLIMTLLSTLPFSIGQVQDAGLIFLNSMATTICISMTTNVPIETKIITVLVVLSTCTTALGITLVILGKFKLASLVSYLPMPVVGGYLAFIGLFCLFAGISICSNIAINSINGFFYIMITDMHSIILSLPGILGGFLLLFVSNKSKNKFMLPGTILGIPIVFYFILYISGTSIDSARKYGWIGPLTPPVHFGSIFTFFINHIQDTQWLEIRKQFFTWLAMTFVVAFSSCLDVAAIEMDMGAQLNINKELQTVGWANIISGLFGGYTGSYIFSQTIFTYRSKTNSRIVGICVIILELLLCLIPFSILSYVPLFFFGSTLIFIAFDLLIEWLYHVYFRILFHEYIVLLMTFISINIVNLELGMILGILFAIINFILGYSQVKMVNRISKRSSTIRNYAKRSYLSKKRDAIVTIQLHGYLFFGSALKITQDVKKYIKIIRKDNNDKKMIYNTNSNHINSKRRGSLIYLDGRELNDYELGYTPTKEIINASKNRLCARTEYLIFDLKNVTGMDATAVRSCFLIMKQLCLFHNIKMIFASVKVDVRITLANNGILDNCIVCNDVDIALEYCEEKILEPYEFMSTPLSSNNKIYSSFLSNSIIPDKILSKKEEKMELCMVLNLFIGHAIDEYERFDSIEFYFTRKIVNKYTFFYQLYDTADSFYLLINGKVTIYAPQKEPSNDKKKNNDYLYDNNYMEPIEYIRKGAFFGEIDFFGEQDRQSLAQAMEDCTVYFLTKENFILMERNHPLLYNNLKDIIMKSMALSITSYRWLVHK